MYNGCVKRSTSNGSGGSTLNSLKADGVEFADGSSKESCSRRDESAHTCELAIKEAVLKSRVSNATEITDVVITGAG